MSASARDRAVRVLRWVLGLVVLWESCLFLRATILRAYGAGHVGVHGWIFLLLASVEIVGAAMFLAPAARVTGGYLLLAVFLFAAAFHILHGEFNEVGWLAVYSAAVVVCLTHSARGREVRS